ncbi:TonB-dependent hemoglobin/transferrin/lactoferrin family receptor [Ensifer sp. HO-A22]|uniref:TonB-dependent hemoglobin/transferrin/lactoferrin family receptor n=1 Tax=Ensifer oleiphilus TaxID=2742698 RepID=A0A7Y6QCN1_9HYPH|nr:TonB-dependent hemoglobin/transferrin/lactoferrin family receptor [Ensifer oleiphilus]NVD43166.1 TonB-dependent hemoglobin/transferrin/lactoferrin family receptor [Ensifer oleiphilus]
MGTAATFELHTLASKHRRALLTGVTALALALPVHTQAQDKTARRVQEETPLERIVVTSTRGAKKVLDVPQSILVITREEITDHNVRDIQDLVRHEPGISVNRTTSITNPWGQLNSFTIRGMGGNRVLLTVDGSRVQEGIIDGSRDFFDMSNFKSVEIVRGPNSVLWGADALGGAVMFQTLDPSDLLTDPTKPWAVEVRTGYDSLDNSWRKQVTAAYDFGDVEVLGSYGQVSSSEAELRKARADGGIWGCSRLTIGCDRLFPADTDVDNALAKVVWTPDAQHTFKLTGELFGRDTRVLQLYDMSASTTGIPSTTAYVNDPYVRDLEMSRKRISLEHDWQVGAAWLDSINWNLTWSPQKRETDSRQRRVYSNRVQLHDQYRNYSEDFLEADIQLQSSFDLGSTHHTLTYGFDGDRTKGDYAGINSTYNSLTGTTTTAINQGFSFPRVDTERADFYLEDNIEFLDGRLTVNPGVRLAYYSIDPTGDASYPGLPGFRPQKQENTELLKRVGAVYKFDDTYSAYASYGEGFKMPTSAQLFQSSTDPFTGSSLVPNPNLKPESVDSYEIGFRGELDRGYFTVATFYADYTNFIRSLQPVTLVGPGGVPVVGYTSNNVEDVALWGIEFGGEYEVLDYTTASANITWTKGRQRTSAGAAATAFDGATPLTAVLGLKHELPDYGLQFEVFGTFAAGRTQNSDPADYLVPGYAVFDAYAKWTPRENVELTAGIENIFDRRYFPNTLTGYDRIAPSVATANVNPLELQTAPGRVFKLGATVRF